MIFYRDPLVVFLLKLRKNKLNSLIINNNILFFIIK
jgi:hypothetical protein